MKPRPNGWLKRFVFLRDSLLNSMGRNVVQLPPFDLAQQTDKILRYEEKLRATHSNVLYPNCLAAKWRERWEQEKEKEKKLQRKEQTSTVWDALNDREEGEVNGTPNHL